MSNLAIHVQQLGKSYRIAHEKSRIYRTLRGDLVAIPQRLWGLIRGNNGSRENIWALRDVSFDIYEGEVVGIIGRNGAGKSTLLKVLSRITEPTCGRAEVYGRVGSLLEVGTGFHPELTGRENIYLNGAILGMTRHEVKSRFDEIVAFAEVEKFLDTPVKHFSNGMYVRLAFAVAAHLVSEILLVDEVLSVGDAEFQRKCLGKMGDVASGGRTVLLVSHNLGAIASLCKQTIYISRGQVEFFGDTQNAISAYTKDIAILTKKYDLDTSYISRRGDGKAKFIYARLLDMNDTLISTITEGEPFKIDLGIRVREAVDISIISITLVDQYSNDLHTTMHYDSLDINHLKEGQYCFTVSFNPNFLSRGMFTIRLACFGINFHEYDHIHHAFSIVVSPTQDRDILVRRPGIVNLYLSWSMKREDSGKL